jgi:hypothetical protein
MLFGKFEKPVHALVRSFFNPATTFWLARSNGKTSELDGRK